MIEVRPKFSEDGRQIAFESAGNLYIADFIEK
jgi:hypothetical protein